MKRTGLRSAKTDASPAETSTSTSPILISSSPEPPIEVHEAIETIPLGQKPPRISKEDLKLLREKQAKLRSTSTSSTPSSFHVQNALESTLIFAQYEAGTAVCIHKDGWVLTCAHCFAEDEGEYTSAEKQKWLLFYNGLAVLVECRVWDPKRDLALCKVIAVGSDSERVPAFSYVPMSESPPKTREDIFCIGQPGRDDLESTSERKTKYNLFEISEGRFRGMVKDVDPQDNSEIGTLKHDAWTYWGHSGAPLLKGDGSLVGLHSSWDDTTAMRHGVPLVAIRMFLEQVVPEHIRSQMGIGKAST